MTAPPEVIFHRYFSTLSAIQRRTHRGKLEIREPEYSAQVVDLLLGVQATMNGALGAEAKNPDHVPHDPFHFDYIDADEANALAFCFGGYSFIGITVPFVLKLLDVGRHLGDSDDVLRLIGIQTVPRRREAIAAAFTRMQLMSVVAHEWSHHVHGHVPVGEDGALFDEFGGNDGNFDFQARELDADGYAAWLVLANTLESPERQSLLELIECSEQMAERQDDCLLAFFFCATAAQLLSRPFVSVVERPVQLRTHPPASLRMNSVIHHALGWLQMYRPMLLKRTPLAEIGRYVQVVEREMASFNGGVTWRDDVEFLKSAEGQIYTTTLNDKIAALKVEIQARKQASRRES